MLMKFKSVLATVFGILLLFLLQAFVCLPTALGDDFSFEPAGLQLSIPKGWRKMSFKTQFSEKEFAQDVSNGSIEDVLGSGKVIASYSKSLPNEKKAILRIVIGISTGYLSPLDHANLHSQIGSGYRQVLPRYISFDCGTFLKNGYDVNFVTGNFQAEDRMQITQYLFSDKNFSYRLVFVYPFLNAEEILADADAVVSSIHAGSPPERFSFSSHAFTIVVFLLSFLVVLVLGVLKMRRKFKASVLLVFLTALFSFPTVANAEVGKDISFSFSEQFESLTKTKRDEVVEQELKSFFSEVALNYVVMASPKIANPVEDLEDYYHLLVYPISVNPSEGTGFSEFKTKYFKFNRLTSYQLGKSETLSMGALEIFSLSFQLEVGEEMLPCQIYARKYDFGWLVVELMASEPFIKSSSNSLLKSLISVQLSETDSLIVEYSAPDLRIPGIVVISILGIIIVVVMIRKKGHEEGE